ncbi:response regulator [Haloarcula nitratireducens]|uniref:Response regulator n=1 Tax=Haloarcula nitratireducens TaxID=2487749 RepID=A0AAW4PDU0_9EURY|nr:response regulator [Halomicroarcula nitratireducens]MBX0296147.1 response regulator [Halomicroarcula nitratireducens]
MSEESTVLVVEDNAADRRLFEEAAAEVEFSNLEFATDTQGAIEFFPTLSEDSEGSDAAAMPDLLLLDLDIPGEGGMALLEELKASSEPCRRVPILVLSSEDDQETIDRAYDLGANAYLTKPVDYEAYVALVAEVRDFWLDRIERPSYRH